MHVYHLGTSLEAVSDMRQSSAGQTGKDSESEDRKSYIKVMTKKEALEYADGDIKAYMEGLFQQGIRFCKAEEFSGYLIGTFYIPSKSMHKSHTGFYYIIHEKSVAFVDDSGFVLEQMKELSDCERWKTPSIGLFFADFLDHLVMGDAVFITELENQLAELEDDVLAGVREDYNHVISACRRKIMVFSHYYLQLSDMGSVLLEDDNHFFTKEAERLLQLFVERVSRLKEEAQLLREYSIQIREVYQSQIDVRQNEIMKVLTIVTTVFLPLSLIAGWYGMNFKNMPELEWNYGYPAVIIISLIVLWLCIWLFKKKKFW